MHVIVTDVRTSSLDLCHLRSVRLFWLAWLRRVVHSRHRPQRLVSEVLSPIPVKVVILWDVTRCVVIIQHRTQMRSGGEGMLVTWLLKNDVVSV